MKPFIIIQTDFGPGGAVCSMKGVIKTIDTEIECYEITQYINKFDAWAASFSLQAVVPYWPKGTIFVSVVDPGVGTNRKASVALLNDGNYVVTPDNGTLSHLYYGVGIKEIREIDESVNRLRGTEETSIFHGRDLFAYCAGKLASGVITFEEVGPKYHLSEIEICKEHLVQPKLEYQIASGFITSGLMHYGGIQFNITNQQWKDCGFELGDYIRVVIKKEENIYFDEVVLYHESFGYVEKSEAILYCGSSKYLCLDLNMDHLINKYKLGSGVNWEVNFQKVEL